MVTGTRFHGAALPQAVGPSSAGCPRCRCTCRRHRRRAVQPGRAGRPIGSQLKGTVSKHVQRLVDAGLVQRSPVPGNHKGDPATADGKLLTAARSKLHDEMDRVRNSCSATAMRTCRCWRPCCATCWPRAGPGCPDRPRGMTGGRAQRRGMTPGWRRLALSVRRGRRPRVADR